ncbi:unnamed protein product [Lactuca saligna]|uniref:DUF4283 domain-containing protein n=1 Tax=Lactuca saligna TaxID=75948 RepID=A0AA35YCQ4_LACSI|nr:unnamed protein product [Lactuca saligna]
MDRWLTKSTLIGEAKSLELLGHMPTLISVHSEHRPSIKYLGGMLALISFDSTVAAREFQENEGNWKDTFKWMKMGSTAVTKSKRIIWIRIVGLPIRLWNNSNFSAIVGKFGKIVVPIDHITSRVDLFVVKLAILTDKLTKFNEEIQVEADGRSFHVGIVEYEDEPWFPFKFDNEEHPYEDQVLDDKTENESMVSESNNWNSIEEDEGVSATWINDMEEGEIIQDGNPNSPTYHTAEKTNEGGDDPTMSCTVVGDDTEHHQRTTSATKTNESGEERPVLEKGVYEATLNFQDNSKDNGKTDRVAALDNQTDPIPSDLQSLGPMKIVNFPTSLAQSGCFGPFPSFNYTPPSVGQHSFDNGHVRSSLKKRCLQRSPPSELTNSIPRTTLFQATERSRPPPIIVSTTTTDEPTQIPQPSAGQNIDVQNHELTDLVVESTEIEATAAVGSLIGFEIEPNNCILAEILGVSGEHNVPQ